MILVVGMKFRMTVLVVAIATSTLYLGAPGSLKAEYCKKIVQQYDGFVHLSMGGILREGIKQNPEDENWLKLLEHVQKGDNVPVVKAFRLIPFKHCNATIIPF